MKKDHEIVLSLLIRSLLYTCLTLGLFAGCAKFPPNQVNEQVIPIIPERELQDNELLNVSISLFDPGELPQNPDKRRGLSYEIRQAEARFAPIHLKHTLQRTGYWGVVRVLPEDDIGAELLVRGKIMLSDGESTVLSIEVVDARNMIWFRKLYAETARPEEHYGTQPEKEDTFQDLFNTIANDLALFRNNLSAEELYEIRQVAAMKYAQSLAPDAFENYLAITPEGRIFLQRLPAPSDPMVTRINTVKVREEMLVDTINSHYDIYYHDLFSPYTSWRQNRQEEIKALRKLENEALTKQLLGLAAIAGAIALGSSDSDTSSRTRPVQDVLITGGAYSIYSGFQTSEESKINKAVIEELGVSFSSEAEPLVIDVEGKTVELTGSAETQYATWRKLLRDIYAEETGLIPSDNLSNIAPSQPTDVQQ